MRRDKMDPDKPEKPRLREPDWRGNGDPRPPAPKRSARADQAVMLDDILLIGEVEKHREIYDPQHTYYKDNVYKEKAWDDVARAVGAHVTHCKRRWKHLRDTYVRKNKQVPGGHIRGWKYIAAMSFLLPYTHARRSPLQDTQWEAPVESDLEEDGVEPGSSAQEPKQSTAPAQRERSATPTPAPAEPPQRPATPTPFSRQQSPENPPQTPAPVPATPPRQPKQGSKGRRKGPELTATEQQLFDILTEDKSTPRVPKDDEEMYYFALSIVPKLRRLPRAAQAQAQVHILTYLASLEKQHSPATTSPSDVPSAALQQQQQQQHWELSPSPQTPAFQSFPST